STARAPRPCRTALRDSVGADLADSRSSNRRVRHPGVRASWPAASSTGMCARPLSGLLSIEQILDLLAGQLLARAVLAQQDESSPSPVARRRSDAEIPKLVDARSSDVEPNRPASAGAGQAGHVSLAEFPFESVLRVATRDTGDPRSPPEPPAAHVSVGVADADLAHVISSFLSAVP